MLYLGMAVVGGAEMMDGCDVVHSSLGNVLLGGLILDSFCTYVEFSNRDENTGVCGRDW